MATPEAHQNLLDAINAYERECGDDARYREIRADLVNLERELMRIAPRSEEPREDPRKNFDKVAERHKSRIEERDSSSTSNDDQAASERSESDGESDKPYADRPTGKRRG